jgi:ATP-dependent 26S proteasome regulatory subunit
MRQLLDILIINKINTIFTNPLISTFLVCIFSYYYNNIIFSPELIPEIIKKYVLNIRDLFITKNIVIIEGNRMQVMGSFNDYTIESYSNRFNAIWFYIIEHIKENTSIHQIREMMNVKQPNGKTTDIFIVSQNNYFMVDESLKIYAYTIIDFETNKDEKSTNIRVKSERIVITLYSYISSVNTIQRFIENINNTYLESIKDLRKNQLFYYIQTDINTEEKYVHHCFKETRFESSRTFDNLFFPEKREIIDKINFFLHNREWYEKMGIPYTLGIGIHGPPGTGKTSFFKALANYVNRHIVNLSFKLITKKKQLQDFYFETRYNYNNQENDIGFDKKIIIFEDLDCAGDIFLDRNIKKKKLEDKQKQEADQNNTTKILSNIAQSLEKPEQIPITKQNEDPITLDDILNLWDGLHETPGRIIAISSNHYDTLDPALVRPGRIDITLEMKLVSRETLKEMFRHFFGFEISEEDLKMFRENVYSPAEIVNIYISSKKDPDIFMYMLLSSK